MEVLGLHEDSGEEMRRGCNATNFFLRKIAVSKEHIRRDIGDVRRIDFLRAIVAR